MSKTCAQHYLKRQLPEEDHEEELSQITKRLQLLEGQKKAYYETAEREKKDNETLIKKLKSQIQCIKDQNSRSGKNEWLVREALEGQATGSDQHQRVEPRDILDTKFNHLGDLTNKLNKLRAKTTKRKRDLESMLSTFETAVVDNIISEENRHPEEAKLRHLNNEIDGMSRKLLETKHVNEKYREVIHALHKEQMTYATRLGMLRQRITTAAGTCEHVQQSLEQAQQAQQRSQHQLVSSQQLSGQLRRERDTVLSQHKQRAEEQKTEYGLLRRQIFVVGPDEPLAASASTESVLRQRRYTELVEQQLSDLLPVSEDMLEVLGARTIADVVKLYEMQADTSRQLNMVWKDTESSITVLRKRKDQSDQQLEHLRYADNLQETKERELCVQLREQIEKGRARHKMILHNEQHLVNTLGGVRTSLVHMIDMLNDSGISVMTIVAQKIKPPSLSDLFHAVAVAIQFLTNKMDTVSVPNMIDEMERASFFGTKSERLALEGKVRAQPAVQPPEKKRFAFLLVDRPDVIDEGPHVPTRAQLKRTARLQLEARLPKIRPPTARELRNARRKSSVSERPLQAMQ